MESLTAATFEQKIDSNLIVVVVFTLESAEPCKQVVDLVQEMTKQEQFNKVKAFTVDMAQNELLAKSFAVNSVPTTLFFHNGNEVDRLVGADPKTILAKMNKVLERNSTLEDRLVSLINQSPIMAFIKGSPDSPRCGFTRTLVTLFKDLNIEYGHFDILSDMEVRQGLKKFKNWPTYPQVYVKGELLGGLDIIQSLNEDNELMEALQLK